MRQCCRCPCNTIRKAVSSSSSSSLCTLLHSQLIQFWWWIWPSSEAVVCSLRVWLSAECRSASHPHSGHRFPAPSKDVVNQCLEFATHHSLQPGREENLWRTSVLRGFRELKEGNAVFMAKWKDRLPLTNWPTGPLAASLSQVLFLTIEREF